MYSAPPLHCNQCSVSQFCMAVLYCISLITASSIHIGALLCRTLIEHMSDHNVRVFVSLAGPQGGMFGSGLALESVICDAIITV